MLHQKFVILNNVFKKGTKAQLQAFIHALKRVPTSLDLVCRCSDRKKNNK